MGRNCLGLKHGFVPSDTRDWVGHSEWRWLVEGQECQAKEFVHQRLVFLAATYGWADGILNKGAQPGGQVEAASTPPSSPASYTSFPGRKMPFSSLYKGA